MKRNIWIGIVLLLAVAGAALAQPDPSRMVDRQLEGMKDRLKLTADQEKKIRPILTDWFKKMAELRQKYNIRQGERPSPEAMKAMREAREDFMKKLGDVLSKEQMEQYQKMMAERRGGPGGPGGGRKKQ
ncbi:MAG: hypothetical protein M1541_04180 [Acidobacteria bacterium]|nr:hypothetical protein [Acidobacteriota bacterium]